ncbi:hypothetical protein CLV93_102356 [Prolixibacter denitrificans]|uniref:Uncharacterized protein n=1 Tax=Prolixibacter denitrificans TaxID=1541063 RepID=A0A2P8CHX1_9BACT|nr:hypothetical protein CLV93_102356 [Prolixibacter denitrificans]
MGLYIMLLWEGEEKIKTAIPKSTERPFELFYYR